jgi:hypothetical protein
MDVLQNPPLKDEPHEAAVLRAMPGDQPTAADPRFHAERSGDMSGTPHLSNTSARPQDVNRASVSKAPEIPIAELRLLANTHDATNGAPIGSRTTRARVYLFIAALASIGAAVVWQHYGRAATETLGTEVVSSEPSSSGSATKEIAAKPELVTAGASEHDVAEDPARQPVTLSAATAAVPSPELKRLDAVVRDLSIVQQGLQQLAANQQDLARNVAALQASRENTTQKPAPSPVSRSTPVQPRKTASTPPPVRAGALPPPPEIAQPPSTQTSTPDHRTTLIPRPPSSMREN